MRLRNTIFLLFFVYPFAACGDDDAGTGPDPDPDPVVPVATEIEISPGTATLVAIGDTVRLEVEVRDQNGNAMAGAAVAWASLDTAVARVSGVGRVEAIAAREARVIAYGGASNPPADTAVVTVAQIAARIEVTPATLTVAQGDTARLSAVAVDSNGYTVEGAGPAYTWASGDPAVASVDDAGLVTAAATAHGLETTIIAAAAGLQASTSLKVMDRLLFVSDREGTDRIYVMNADGSDEARLSDGLRTDVTPVWSPDGTRITHATLRDGDWRIHVMDADGGAAVNLTNSPDIDEEPIWSPDGSKIAYLSRTDSTESEIYVIDVDGGNSTNLPNHPGLDSSPAWWPDGLRIAFASARGLDYEIYVVNADGSGLVRLTDNAEIDLRPLWQPRRINP